MAEKKKPAAKAEGKPSEKAAEKGNYVPRLKVKYTNEIAPALMKKFSYKSVDADSEA